MKKRILGKTDIQIAPLVFGGNVLGWTINEKTSFDVLDAFIDHGFNAIDTADVYSLWASGNVGGESETIIGNWLKANPSKRDKVQIFSKVGSDLGIPGHKGLSEKWILKAVEDSLCRLQTECIDLYFSHWPDATPHEETLGAYEKLLKAGKIRHIGASNYSVQQLKAAKQASIEHNLPFYEVLEPEYNLYDRAGFDGELSEYCLKENIGVITYYSLASGFLSGKYRSEADLQKSKRGEGVAKYLNDRGMTILAALDKVAAVHSSTPVEVALAWIMAQKTVTAPIASATSVEQVELFAKAANLALAEADLEALNKASALKV